MGKDGLVGDLVRKMVLLETKFPLLVVVAVSDLFQ